MDRIERVLPPVLGVIMVLAAVNKLISAEFRSTLSESIQVSESFLILVALFELVLAVCFFVPRLRLFAGLGLLWVMLGAGIFHWFGIEVDGQNPRSVLPVNVMLGLLGLNVAWLTAGRPSTVAAMREAIITQAKDVAAPLLNRT